MANFVILILWLIPLGFLAAVAWVWLGRRPTPERFATAQGIVHRRGVTPPRCAPRCTAPTSDASPVRSPVRWSLGGWPGCSGTTAAIPYLVLLGLVAGTMVGIAVAQHRRRRPGDAVRHASLTARTVADYAPRARGVVRSAITGIAVSRAARSGHRSTRRRAWAPTPGSSILAAAAVVVVPLGRILQRRVVEALAATRIPHRRRRAAPYRGRCRAPRGPRRALLRDRARGSHRDPGANHADHRKSTAGRVLHAPPGSTSISVDTGRQAVDPERRPSGSTGPRRTARITSVTCPRGRRTPRPGTTSMAWPACCSAS